MVFRNFRLFTQHVAIAGKIQEQEIKVYNLDVIISVDESQGYNEMLLQQVLREALQYEIKV